MAEQEQTKARMREGRGQDGEGVRGGRRQDGEGMRRRGETKEKESGYQCWFRFFFRQILPLQGWRSKTPEAIGNTKY